jgi:hypothetical protein
MAAQRPFLGMDLHGRQLGRKKTSYSPVFRAGKWKRAELPVRAVYKVRPFVEPIIDA